MSVTLRNSDREALKAVIDGEYDTDDAAYRALLDVAAICFTSRPLWALKPARSGVMYGPLYTKHQVRQACTALSQPVRVIELAPLGDLLTHVAKHESLVDPDSVCGCGHPLAWHWSGCTVHGCGCPVNDAA